MLPKLLLLVLLHIPLLCDAHPSIAIKFDSKGNLYYSDLYRVYKVSPTGHKTVAVQNVHTHELSIDGYDNVYGEHLWYEGDATKKWGHYIWRLSPSGTLTKTKDSTEGFLKNYSFLRDSADNLYFLERPGKENDTFVFKKITPGGIITILGRRKFENVSWQFVDRAGTLYFLDGNDLYRLDKSGQFTLLAKDLGKSAGSFGSKGHTHSLMGLWMDKFNEIYVANFSGHEVKKITRAGESVVVYAAKDNWSPTGGTFDKDNNLWLLEADNSGECRVTKVSKASLASASLISARKKTSLGINYKTFLVIIPVIVIFGWLVIKNKRAAGDNSVH